VIGVYVRKTEWKCDGPNWESRRSESGAKSDAKEKAFRARVTLRPIDSPAGGTNGRGENLIG